MELHFEMLHLEIKLTIEEEVDSKKDCLCC